ncbi:MAG: porin family protein [Candidatus Aminicenantes bacterium]|nr:porin family protein [Candidatus Aminicenantes bacterium]
MKKSLIVCGLLFFVLALTVSPAQAVQITAKGVKGGLVIATMTGDDIEKNDAKIGFALGGYLTLNISNDFSIQPELLLVQKGTKWSEGGGTQGFRLTYLEIPILAKYSFAAGTNMNVFVFAGPALAFKIRATVYGEYGDESDSEDLDYIKGMDFGLAFGGGLEMPFGKNVLTFDIRYTFGLGNCWKAADGDDSKIKNSAIMFLAGIGF